jgi:hypothetical protein
MSEKQKLKMIDAFDRREEDIQGDKDALLRKLGWTQRCDFPGSFWLWCKEINGTLVAVSADTALHMESNIY